MRRVEIRSKEAAACGSLVCKCKKCNGLSTGRGADRWHALQGIIIVTVSSGGNFARNAIRHRMQ